MGFFWPRAVGMGFLVVPMGVLVGWMTFVCAMGALRMEVVAGFGAPGSAFLVPMGWATIVMDL